jgi:prolyl 4-hydroxylase
VAQLDAAGKDGDGEARFARGLWRIDGRILSRDLPAARADFEAAAASGSRDAVRVHTGFLAAGYGGGRDWAGALRALAGSDDPVMARQAALLAAMSIDDAGNPVDIPLGEALYEVPSIRLFRSFMSPDECALLVELAEARLRPALIFHEARKSFVADPLRDSDAAGFPIVLEWPFVHALNRRIAAASGTEVAQGEPLQVLRYAPGQQYRPHLDAVPGMANQRVLTALVWLNDDYEGGETRFLESGLAVKGRRGDLMIFANALSDGRPDPATRHAGEPVKTGVKLLASRWIRARPAAPGTAFGPEDATG